MQVAKWGNSLAIRIPSAVAEALSLKEGDEVQVRVAEEKVFELVRDSSRDEALARIRSVGRKLPPDWRIDREEANAR